MWNLCAADLHGLAHVTERLQLQAISEILISTEPWANSPEVLAHLERLMATEDVLAFSKKLVALDAAVVSMVVLEGRWNIEERGGGSRLPAYFFGHRHAARYLDEGRLAAALAYKPFAEAQNEFSTGSSPGFLGPEYRNALAKGQLVMSQRHLVKAALAMRRMGLTQGAYPPACPALEVLTSPIPWSARRSSASPRAMALSTWRFLERRR